MHIDTPNQCMNETFCFKIKKPIKAVNNGLQLTMKLLAPADTSSCPWLRNKLYKKIPINPAKKKRRKWFIFIFCL